VKFRAPPSGSLVPNSEFDPLPTTTGLWSACLPSPSAHGARPRPNAGRRVLEIGVGSGILVPSLTAGFPEYLGTDLLLAPDSKPWSAPGATPAFRWPISWIPMPSRRRLRCGGVPVGAGAHCGSRSRRPLSGSRARPGGTLVTGYPMVNRFMATCFRTLGFGRIEDTTSRLPPDHESLGRRMQPSAGQPAAFAPQSLRCTSARRGQ